FVVYSFVKVAKCKNQEGKLSKQPVNYLSIFSPQVEQYIGEIKGGLRPAMKITVIGIVSHHFLHSELLFLTAFFFFTVIFYRVLHFDCSRSKPKKK
uniref:Uncharacterized protein n=1 Tax=Nothoprocta perdicaria TaxID=30464 RepID=A0A8C6Z850_NOTPE